ncbi:Gfo/Idh/MocA family protein [Microvirga rosea]|uniref:Gfo/Idh/MocA family protein n=1 Tax=Microvirga rosea TaxID=2715425 RepID=UPI001D09A2E5|nr:Gfo/Idh/MocA family oxidoreductase [Microvirga rosea]MCB8821950.1 Gfo/Idh/MocA family oxidoreductase [Microvirga rosea]
MTQALDGTPPMASIKRLRLGFLGVGWIGRHRMQAILRTGLVEVAAIADPSPEMAVEAKRLAPDAGLMRSLDELLDEKLDGVVIATPSALHAEQCIHALERGVAVFCQKPLGRTASEVQAVVDAARTADQLLTTDFSYRFTDGMRRIRHIIRSGELGPIYAADLVFHNAYGPDKSWFYDPALSGGGCVMDLGVHLVDLALWCLGFPRVSSVTSWLFAGGEPLRQRPGQVEDYAIATMELDTGEAVQLACSWRLHAGCDAIISATFYGPNGGVSLRNVNGSFYDFIAERYRGTSRETLATPPDDWGGRAAADWAARLAAGEGFDPEAERFVDVARIIDRIYKQ